MDITERITVAVAALVLTHAAALYFRIGAIEADLLTQARTILTNRGLATVQVRANGRDLTLAGTVSNRRAADLAVSLAADIDGVRVVHDALETGH